MIIPLAMAIHGVPLYPVAKTREAEFKYYSDNRAAWMFAQSHQNLRKFRISAKEGK